MNPCKAKNPSTCPHHSYNYIVDQEMQKLINHSFALPNEGVSGHSMGSLMEQIVFNHLSDLFPELTKTHDFLNNLMSQNAGLLLEKQGNMFPDMVTNKLFGISDTIAKKWSTSNLIKDKQDYTADFLYLEKPENGKNIIRAFDVKSAQHQDKIRQQNVVSSRKIFIATDFILDSKAPPAFSLHYLGAVWERDKKNPKDGVIKQIHTADLFKIPPSKLYFNWAASGQIQFNILDVPQNYNKSPQEWSLEYQKCFLESESKKLTQLANQNELNLKRLEARLKVREQFN